MMNKRVIYVCTYINMYLNCNFVDKPFCAVVNGIITDTIYMK
jgi:hypothetical protein